MRSPTKRVQTAHDKVYDLLRELSAGYHIPFPETADGAKTFAANMLTLSKKARKLSGYMKEWAQAIRAQENARSKKHR